MDNARNTHSTSTAFYLEGRIANPDKSDRDDDIQWSRLEVITPAPENCAEGVILDISIDGRHYGASVASRILRRSLRTSHVRWLEPLTNVQGSSPSVDYFFWKGSAKEQLKGAIHLSQRWAFNLTEFATSHSAIPALGWLRSTICCEPTMYHVTRVGRLFRSGRHTLLRFKATREEIETMAKQRIFLSHRGSDKPLARSIANVLNVLGYQVWLDEDVLTAGEPLERGLLAGMKDSCAAVFLVSPRFVDDSYLATEIDYALQEKRDKGNRFMIITLLLEDQNGRIGTVPDLLKTYVWKTPKDQLQMMLEIVRALPVGATSITWRSRGGRSN